MAKAKSTYPDAGALPMVRERDPVLNVIAPPP